METLTQHLNDALRSNAERLPRYAEISNGRSVGISKTLLRYERLAMPFAHLLQLFARPYWRRGLPILKVEFVSMTLTPPFAAVSTNAPGPLPPFTPLPVVRWGFRLLGTYWRRGAMAAHEETCRFLASLPPSPRIHCMVRHILESLARVLSLDPQFRQLARDTAAPSTAWASWCLVLMHLTSLAMSHRLDRKAYPLQVEGIPILERDVPPIPLEADLSTLTGLPPSAR